MPYGMISILVISRCAAPPYPAAPDFPPSGGQNKTPRDNLLINPPLEMTVLADTPIVISTEAKRRNLLPPMVHEAWRREISRLRVSSKRFPSAPYRHAAPLEMTMVASASLVISTEAKRSGEISRPQMTEKPACALPSFRPKRSGVEKSPPLIVRATLRWKISRLRVSWARFPSAPYRHAAPLEMTVLASTPLVISTEAKRSGEISFL